MEQTRYATEDDFGGRLYYRLAEAESGFGLGRQTLWDLDAITHSVTTLRQAFEQLERAGVCIPTGYALTHDWLDRQLGGKVSEAKLAGSADADRHDRSLPGAHRDRAAPAD